MHTAVLIAVMAVSTALLRFLPFLVFGSGKQIPETMLKLSRKLPQAVIGMLVIYCLKDVNMTVSPFGIPELAALCCVCGLQAFRHNPLLSILGGTAVYMVLIQMVF